MPFTVNDFYKNAVLKLTGVFGPEEARAMTDRLFEHYFRLSPVQRVLSSEMLADGDKTSRIDEAVNKLLQYIPLQYVLGEAFFMDMEFIVNPSVLIPRPETEELVTLILKQYSGRKSGNRLNILDIGTGSGCIPIALKRNLPESTVFSVDISEEALKVAAENALLNHVEVNFVHSDILDPTNWEVLPRFDLIVSNPPYVTHAEKKHMQPNVLDHEPHIALFVPDDDPLLFYRAIIGLAKIKLCETGSLWFEINEMFASELKELAESKGFKEVNIFFDIRGKSRFLHAVK